MERFSATGMTGVACKPRCMAIRGKSKRAQGRADSYARQRLEHDAASVKRSSEMQRIAERARTANALAELETTWGGRAQALRQLSDVSATIERLRREQHSARSERDELIARLRNAGESWNSLAALTGLSRQALSRRTPNA